MRTAHEHRRADHCPGLRVGRRRLACGCARPRSAKADGGTPACCRHHRGAVAAGLSPPRPPAHLDRRSEEHTSELQSLMRISYAVFCLKKKTKQLKRTKDNIL